MKKVLILAYDFPPYVSVGGLRPYSWFKYFKEFDVYPVIITRQWGNRHGNHLDYIDAGTSNETLIEESVEGTIIRTPYHPNWSNRIMLKYGDNKYRFLRRLVTAYYEMMQFVSNIGPKANLYRAANEYLKSNKVDVIIATGDPFILFKYANGLGKAHNTPWIADYRDLWSQLKNAPAVSKKWQLFFEKKYLKTAHSVITVSEFLITSLKKINDNKNYHIISNGFDPDAVDAIKNIPQNKEILRIAYIGSIYSYNPIEIFLQSCNEFVKGKNDLKICFEFYGVNMEAQISDLLNTKFKALKPYVKIFPKIQNSELLKILAEVNVLLLFNYYSFMGTKIYDYLALKRRILLCFLNDPEANKLRENYFEIDESDASSDQLQADLINSTNSGNVILDSKHLKYTLEQLYQEFVNSGNIKCESVGVEKYSRKMHVKELSKIIHEM